MNERLYRLLLIARLRTVGVGHWMRRHPGPTAGLLVNLLLMFLPFYDATNIPLALAVTTHFNSNSAVFSSNGWVAGPFIIAMYIPGHLAYIASGYNLYWSYTTLKGIYFGLTAWMAYAFYAVFRARGSRWAEGAAVFTLLNPALLFVDYIWVQYDVFPVAFLTVGYVLLRYGQSILSDHLRILIGVLLIAVSIFFYWFPLVLVPLLLYYSSTRRERALLFAYFAAILGLLFAFMTYAISTTLGQYTDTLVGKNAVLNRSSFFGVQHFQQLTTFEYVGLLLALVFLLPLLLRWARLTEAATGLVVVTLFLVTSTVPTADNYVFVFPFAVLALAHRPASRLTYLAMYGLLAYPLTGLLLSNFLVTNSQPDGVGIFYWGFDLFHSNVYYLTTLDARQQFLLEFNGATFVAIGLSFVLLALLSRPRTHADTPFVAPPDLPRPRPRVPARGQFSLGGKRIRSAILVVGILSVSSLGFNAVFPNLVQYHGQGEVPVYFLAPQFIPDNGNIVRPLSQGSFSVSGDTVNISSGAPPMQFARWFLTESVSLAGVVAFHGISPRSALALIGSPFSVSLRNQSEPDARAATVVAPNATGSVRNVTNFPPLLHRSDTDFGLDGNASLTYSLNTSSFSTQYYAYAFELTDPGAHQSTIFHIQGLYNFAALVTFPTSTILVYGGAVTAGRFVEVELPVIVQSSEWGFVEVHSTRTNFSVDLNGETTVIPEPLFPSGQATVVLGLPPYPTGYNDTFQGFLSPLYSRPTPFSVPPAFEYLTNDSGRISSGPLSTPGFNFTLTSNLTSSRLTLDQVAFLSNQQSTSFGVEKSVADNYEVGFELDEFTMNQLGANHYYLVPAFWAFVSPFALLALSIPSLRRLQRTVPRYLPTPPTHGPENGR